MYGTFLRRLRTGRGLTQAQLAEIVGIDQPNLSAYENDRRVPSLDTFHRLVAACGYELVASAGARELALGMPRGTDWFTDDDLPPSDPSDPAFGAHEPVVAEDAPARRRARAIVDVVAAADAIARAKALLPT